MGSGAAKQQKYKAEDAGVPLAQPQPAVGAAKEPKADYGGVDGKQQDNLCTHGGLIVPAMQAPPATSAVTLKRSMEFNASVEDVVDWESISGPAMRHAVPMLVELESERKCDAWLWRPMHYAAIYGAAGAVEALARAGASVDARTGGHGLTGKALSKASFNFSALIECALTGAMESVRAMEVNGDFVTVMQPHTRVKMTADLESCTCVGYSTGQQPNHVRRFGFATPLHIAIEFRHLGAVQALLDAQADPNNTWNENRDRPLHTAVAQGNDETVEALLSAKADPNTEDSWGRVPLIIAAVCCKQPTANMAVLLLDANARQSATDRSGKTAAQLAREAGHGAFADAVEHYDINERADFVAARMAELERQRQEAEEQQRREAEERARIEAIEQARRAAEEEARRQAELEWNRKMEEEAKARAEAEEQARLEAEERAREAEERARKEAERDAKERERREAAERAFAEAEEKAKRQKEEQAADDARRLEEERLKRELEEQAREKAEQERLAAEAAEQQAMQAMQAAQREAEREAEERALREAEDRAHQEAEERARQEAEEQARREEEERLQQEREAALKMQSEGQQELQQRWLVALARVAGVAALSKRRDAWHREFAKVRSDRWDRAIARPPLDATTGRMIAGSQRVDLLRQGGLIKEANKLEAELRRKGVNLERLHAKWARMAELSKLAPEEATTVIVSEFGYGE